jgi:hypothetical protein
MNEATIANRFWNQAGPGKPLPYSIGICAAADFSIQSCAASFTFDPTPLIMAPGAVAQATVTALDSSTNATALPGDMTYSSANQSIASAVAMAGVTVTAATTIPLSPSDADITATDPSTGAQGTLPVTVVYPTLVLSASTFTVMTVSQTLTVSLEGPNGASIALPSGITWSTDGSSSTINPVTVTGSVSTWTIPANATPGTVTITATDPYGNSYPPATVTVQSGSTYTYVGNALTTLDINTLSNTITSSLPGPVTATVVFAQPVAANYTGTVDFATSATPPIGINYVKSFTLASSGVVSQTCTAPYYSSGQTAETYAQLTCDESTAANLFEGSAFTFTNGRIVQWFLYYSTDVYSYSGRNGCSGTCSSWAIDVTTQNLSALSFSGDGAANDNTNIGGYVDGNPSTWQPASATP